MSSQDWGRRWGEEKGHKVEKEEENKEAHVQRKIIKIRQGQGQGQGQGQD